MLGSLQDGFLFLISTLFDLYIFILIIRIVLAWVGSNYSTNPLTQLVVTLTSFIIKPLKKIIPDYRKIEFSTLALILLLVIIKQLLLLIIPFRFPHLGGLLILVIGDTLKLTLEIFFYAILVQAIVSWIQPGPATQALSDFTSPIMKPLQRLIPPISGFDISPIPALIILQLLLIILVNPMIAYGKGAALGLT